MPLTVEVLADRLGEPHLSVRDGCNANLEGRTDTLPPQQGRNFEQDRARWKRKLTTEGYLFYLNTQTAEALHFDGPETELALHCPGCGSDYQVTKSMYDHAVQEFQQKNHKA